MKLIYLTAMLLCVAVCQSCLDKPDDQWTIYFAPFGECKEVTLPDYTTVRLNAGSSIRYKGPYLKEVWLDGEAFFEVYPVTDGYFKVCFSNVVVQSMDGQFNVNAYDLYERFPSYDGIEPGMAEKRVAVYQGYVHIGNGQFSKNLHSEKCADATDNLIYERYWRDCKNENAWTRGEYFFDMKEAGFILKSISRAYDVNLIYDNTLIEPVNFHMTTSTPVDSVLSELAKVAYLKVKKITDGTFQVAK